MFEIDYRLLLEFQRGTISCFYKRMRADNNRVVLRIHSGYITCSERVNTLSQTKKGHSLHKATVIDLIYMKKTGMPGTKEDIPFIKRR